MSERHIELTWRCSTCKHKNLGRHMACQGCGNPKDASEEYEMPADPSAVASVEDEKLLGMAKAGAHWKCQYCGSDQRDLDGGCARCGAGRAHGANASPQAPMVPIAVRPARKTLPPIAIVALAGGGVLTLIVFLLILSAALTRKPPEPLPAAVVTSVVPPVLTAEVTGISWKRTIKIERWQLAAHEAFTDAVPAGALEVRAAGQKVHHNEDVFDHDETVYDDVEVPDGVKTETYTERVKCGEDCTTTPQTCRPVCTRTPKSCRQVCTNSKNGFASCKDVCTGGDETCRQECTGGTRSCTPKFCNETKTKATPKTRIEKRARIVKKYRSEPRYAAWSTFKLWEWVVARTESDEGTDLSLRWPDAGSLTDAGPLADGGIRPAPGTQRESREERFTVELRDANGVVHQSHPESEEDLVRFKPGTRVTSKDGKWVPEP